MSNDVKQNKASQKVKASVKYDAEPSEAPHGDVVSTAPGKIVAKELVSVLDRELSQMIREKSITAREAASIREITTSYNDEAAEEIQTASKDQILTLQQANAKLVVATLEAQKLTEQVQKAKAELDYMAHYDVLTDLPNRALLQDRLNQAIEMAHRLGKKLAMMFMDLDQFKHINDSLGHAVGDQLLQAVARRLQESVRHSDTISRQGGDEFLLLLPVIEHADDVALSAQKIIDALAPAHILDQHDIHISASIGISIYPDDGQDAETLLKCADTAMYHAKEIGRNNYQYFKAEMNTRAVKRQSTESDLRRALEQQEFVLYYQPKVNLHSGAIIGVEALIRWQHPQRGLLLPAQFVRIAEECGLILPISRWVLREACHTAQCWQQSGLLPIILAVNTSALEFRAPDFFDNIRTTLLDTHLQPGFLELELTESILMRDVKATSAILHALADLGVKLAVDDFGTGYSSLSYLSQFPISTLKIDQSFVNKMIGTPDDTTIVSAVINLGKSLKLRVIAEGVETPEQYAFLLDHRCDEGQGHYFCQPVPAGEFSGILAAGNVFTRTSALIIN